MSSIAERLTEAYTVLVLAEIKTIDELPEYLRKDVEIAVAEKTIEVLS